MDFNSLEEIRLGIKDNNPFAYMKEVDYIYGKCSFSPSFSQEEMGYEMLKSAESGNVYAMAEIAKWYDSGIYFEQSEEKHFQWLKKIVNSEIGWMTAQSLFDEAEGNIYYRNDFLLDAYFFSEPVGEAALQLGLKEMNISKKENLNAALNYLKIAYVCRCNCEKYIRDVEKRLHELTQSKTTKKPTLETTSSDFIANLSQKNIDDFGKVNWDNLSEVSQKYINTATFAFQQLLAIEENNFSYVDFSIVVSPLLRALELELKIRLYEQYLDYLKNTFHNVEDYLNYNNISGFYEIKSRNIIITKNAENVYCFENQENNKFTLGSLKYFFGMKNKKTQESQEITIDKSALDFLSIHVKKDNLSLPLWVENLCNDIETVRGLRNESSHGGTILSLNDAQYIINQLIKIKRILINLISDWQ